MGGAGFTAASVGSGAIACIRQLGVTGDHAFQAARPLLPDQSGRVAEVRLRSLATGRRQPVQNSRHRRNRNRGVQPHQPSPVQPVGSAGPAVLPGARASADRAERGGGDPIEQLKDLADVKTQGILTDEESPRRRRESSRAEQARVPAVSSPGPAQTAARGLASEGAPTRSISFRRFACRTRSAHRARRCRSRRSKATRTGRRASSATARAHSGSERRRRSSAQTGS